MPSIEHTSFAPRPPDRRLLTDRQRACLELAAQGCSSATIGHRLSVSPRTVDEHLALACQAMGVRTRVQAVARMVADRVAPAVPTSRLRP